MKRNFKLVIEYDGTAYHGWQRQLGVDTIQETIEKAVQRMTKQVVTVHGSGRTDAGVHAWNQVASFVVDSTLSCETFRKGLDSLTPRDIVIKVCQSVPMIFHARFDAVSKIYEYMILNRPIPEAISRQYAWHIRKSLDIALIRQGASMLVGTHDFAAFEASGSPRRHTIRTVSQLSVEPGASSRVVFTIAADGFLRCMVRNIVGTLVEVGLGKTSLNDLRDIFQSKDRNNAGMTAPPHGLFLKEVKY